MGSSSAFYRLPDLDASGSTERIPLRDFIRLVARALDVSYRARGRAAMLVSLSGFAFALMPSLISVALRDFTDAVQGLFQGDARLSHALVLMVALMGLHLLQQGFSSVRSYYVAADAERILHYLNERILRITCAVKMRYIDGGDDFAAKISFASTHAGLQVANSMQEVTLWLQNLLSFSLLAVVVSQVNAWIIPVVVVTCLPSVALAYRQERERYGMNRQQSREIAFAQLHYLDCTRFQCLQERRFQRVIPYFKWRKWRPAVDGVVQADVRMTRKHVLQSCAADLLQGGVYAVVLLVVAHGIFQNPSVGLGSFTLAVSATAQMQTLIGQMFFGAAQFAAHAHYMKDFFELDDFEREEDRVSSGRNPVRKGSRSESDIVFSNVTFAYPGGTHAALKNVSVTIRQGEKVAIVGRNGSGKSTFINLLCGLYQAQQGCVSVGGLDPAQEPNRVRNRISAIFQDFGRYEDTIRFNVTISDKGRNCSDEELTSLLLRADAVEFVRSRKDGLDAQVGVYSEGGANLSGGQWQRLAIARAAYCERASIMVLDEPTSALDPVAEANVYRNFSELVGDRTALLVSHRLGIASVVDRVLVFDEGQIVEDGSPADLLAKGGLFARLYASQAEWYRP